MNGCRRKSSAVAALVTLAVAASAGGTLAADSEESSLAANPPLRASAFPHYGRGKGGALVALTLSLRNGGTRSVRVFPSLRIVGFTRFKRMKRPFAYDVRPAQFPGNGVLSPGELVEIPVVPPACVSTADIRRVAVTLVVRAAFEAAGSRAFDVSTNRFDVPTLEERPESHAVTTFRVVCRP